MTLDADPLTTPGFMQDPPPPPQPRRLGCSVFVLGFAFLLASSVSASVPTPRETHELAASLAVLESRGTPDPIPGQAGTGIETRSWLRPGGSELGFADVSAEARRERDLLRRQLVPVLPGEHSGVPPSAAGGSTPSASPLASVAAQSAIGTALVGGWATFYDDGPGRYAAVPWWEPGGEPYPVRVCRMDNETQCVVTLVRDFCACGSRGGTPTVIDLSPESMSVLEPAYERLGVLRVTVEWPVSDDERMRLEVGDGLYELPATDSTEGSTP